MKKMLYLLLLLPAVMLGGCSKEEVAPFDLTLSMSGVTEANGQFYAVSGDEVTIQSLTAKALGNTATQVSNVMFYLDGMPLFPTVWNVNPLTFSTSGIPAGRHSIGVTGYLLQVDHSLKDFSVSYPLVIVDNQENLPEGAPETGTYSLTVTFDKAN